MEDKLSLEWVEKRLEEARKMGNTPQNVRDYALLSIARDHMEKEKEHKMHDALIGPDGRYNDVRHAVPIVVKNAEGPLTMKEAKTWVQHMQGAPFTVEEAAKYAEEMWMDDDDVFPAFWAVMNAMYTDYMHVAKEFHVHRPEFYAAMAKSWLRDEDAVKDKARIYYEHIVKHE